MRMVSLLLCVGRVVQLQNTVNSPQVNVAGVEEDCITLQNPSVAAVYKLEAFFKCLRCGSQTELNEVQCCSRQCGILNESTLCDSFRSADILVVKDHQKKVK